MPSLPGVRAHALSLMRRVDRCARSSPRVSQLGRRHAMPCHSMPCRPCKRPPIAMSDSQQPRLKRDPLLAFVGACLFGFQVFCLFGFFFGLFACSPLHLFVRLQCLGAIVLSAREMGQSIDVKRMGCVLDVCHICAETFHSCAANTVEPMHATQSR